ncbi:hypothetical protein CO111_06365 [Candidatus Desantisbacteria bacterium CG_4_9_14_3_um_filter_50_7]|nr:MAG: hypothetical protein CO111_06365 [Candidatus Desantisbacteria bacterium CG_4_9_14_3_um_filter_50_7]
MDAAIIIAAAGRVARKILPMSEPVPISAPKKTKLQLFTEFVKTLKQLNYIRVCYSRQIPEFQGEIVTSRRSS